MKKLYGITVPIVTPFTKDDKVDIESLKSLTEFLIDKGVHCLYPGGSTGEMLLMNLEERKVLAEVVVRQTAGRLPVYVQVGTMNLRDTIELAQHAASVGADGIAVVTPSYFGLDEQELLNYYQSISTSVPKEFPIYLYGIPQCSVNDITVDLAQKIANSCPNVIGIKYSYGDMQRMQDFMTIRDGEFSVLTGHDGLFAAVVMMGGDGTVSGNSQVVPEHYIAVWESLQAGDYVKAAAAQRKTNVLNAILSSKNNAACYKAALKYRGVIAEDIMRAPLRSLCDEEREALIKTLEENHFTEI